MKSLLFRFNEYQKERFPFSVLVFTTLSVVLSSAAILIPETVSLSSLFYPILVGTITCLLFMFSIRVFDDFKDENFDSKFHKKRPVQRGLISLKELNRINAALLIIQVVLNLFISLQAFFYWVVAFCYSLIARNEFFCKDFIRKRFILYNFLNLMQMFFLQVYLYALLQPPVTFKDPLLFIHFIFVLSNAVILEIARKMKSKAAESKGKDTYSSRYGVKKAAYMYAGAYFATYILFLLILLQIGFSYVLFFLSLLALLSIILTTCYYVSKQTTLRTKLLERGAVFFYLSMHLLLVGSVL